MPLTETLPFDRRRWFRRDDLLQVLAFVVIYILAAKIGFQAAFVAEQVSPVWPPAGLALWALLYFGVRLWPGIWIGAFVVNITTHVPLIPACAIATGNTLEAVAAVWLLRRFTSIDRLLERVRDIIGVVLGAAVVSTAISATIGVLTLCIAGVQPWNRFGLLWWIWWLGDATGDLLVAPVLLTAPLWWRARRVGELLALEGITIAVTALVFVYPLVPQAAVHPLEFIVFPLVIWAGLRFAHPGAAMVAMTISFIAVWGTLRGTGPFSVTTNVTSQDSIVLLQIYTAVIATSGLALGGAIADRNRSEALRLVDHTLTGILSQSEDLESAAPLILRTVCDTLGWDLGMMWLVDGDRHVLDYVNAWQRDPRTNEFVAFSRGFMFTPGVGLPGRVWASAEPAWIYDVVGDGNFPRAPIAARVGLHAAFAFPIVLKREVLGIIEFFALEPRRPDSETLTLMSAVGSQIGQFIDRRRAQQRVVESEALNSAIVDAALDCVISIDADGRILEFNPASAATFGISCDQALGRELAEVIVPPRLRELHRSGLRRCVETGESRILGTRIEIQGLRADGTEFPIELSITRVRLGERIIFTAHLRDITDRKHLEEERSESLARERLSRIQAEEANRSKDQFLAVVSHELRTPLTAILGWASMLQTREFDREKRQQICDTLFRNAQAQAQIVDDLLDVSRIVTGQLRLDLQAVDFCDIARLSLETVRPTANAKGIALNSRIPAGSCRVAGDPARLQQLIWNLLSNALKFTPSGGSVTLSVSESGPNMIIQVVDTGKGIQAPFLPRVFERFWQGDSTTTRTHGGLGLGLALVRHIAELHGGEVQVNSEGEGRGSTFTVILPAFAPSQLMDATKKISDVFVRAPDGATTVLVVDDDPAARELFSTVLETRGFHVLSAASAPRAFEVFVRQRPHVMLVDIGMPGEDGFSFLRHVRDHEVTHGLSRTPAVAVTAYAGATARRDVMAAGFAAHLPKPALPHDMIAAVIKAINQPL